MIQANGVLLECCFVPRCKALAIPEFDFALSKQCGPQMAKSCCRPFWFARLRSILHVSSILFQTNFCAPKDQQVSVEIPNSKTRQSACTLNTATMTDISDPWSNFCKAMVTTAGGSPKSSGCIDQRSLYPEI